MKNVAQIRRTGTERAVILQSETEKNIADGTQYLHDLANSGSSQIEELCKQMKEEQSDIETKILNIVRRIDLITAETMTVNKGMAKIEKQALTVPPLLPWILMTTSQLASIKQQAKFLEHSMSPKSHTQSQQPQLRKAATSTTTSTASSLPTSTLPPPSPDQSPFPATTHTSVTVTPTVHPSTAEHEPDVPEPGSCLKGSASFVGDIDDSL